MCKNRRKSSVFRTTVRERCKKEKPENLMIYWLFLAERVGFEPTVGCPTPDFESLHQFGT